MRPMPFADDRGKSLERLERDVWPEADAEDTYVVRTCHALRKVPLRNLTTEDIRLLVGQQISMSFILPIALEILTEDLLAEGDFFPGDLLAAVLRSDARTWETDHRDKLVRLLESTRLEDPYLRTLVDRFFASIASRDKNQRHRRRQNRGPRD